MTMTCRRRGKWWRITFFLVAVFSSLLVAVSGAAQLPSGRLVVIGVENEAGRPEWDDQLIGYGLARVLLQHLYDTGLYTPVEDNPEIVNEIKRLVGAYWKGDVKGYSPADADALARKFDCDVTAYAKIKKFATTRSRTSVGPFSSAETVVTIEVEVTVKKAGEAEIRASGEGSSSTKAKSMMFKIRDNKVRLDETSVGRATEKAIKNAVEKLRQ